MLCLLLAVAAACSPPPTPLPDGPSVAPTPPPPIVFPRDAAPHDTLTEWWYYTGHLTSAASGRAYGFEFVIFQVRRVGAPAGYLAHFAISDIDGGRFSHQARVAQVEAAPLAFPLDVDGWRLDSAGSTDAIEAAMAPASGAEAAFAVRLALTDAKPPALHHGGYIDYGPAGGSYYYSRTRLDVSGELGLPDGSTDAVSGIAWFDHQWGDFIVTPLGGWDWYSLQLDDQTELMLYVLRGRDGAPSQVYGTRVLANGRAESLSHSAVEVSLVGTWTSPHTGAVYPSGWRVSLPDGTLELEPQLKDQELWFPTADAAAAMPYWEGAVTVRGARTGQGYVELTGYATR